MLRLYTYEKGKYFTLEQGEKVTDVIKVPYEFEETKKKLHPYDDVMHDFLLQSTSRVLPKPSKEEEQELIDQGFDTNLDNWASIECPYLPFIHYLYIPEGWIL